MYIASQEQASQEQNTTVQSENQTAQFSPGTTEQIKNSRELT
jgi:hypothetical protein